MQADFILYLRFTFRPDCCRISVTKFSLLLLHQLRTNFERFAILFLALRNYTVFAAINLKAIALSVLKPTAN